MVVGGRAASGTSRRGFDNFDWIKIGPRISVARRVKTRDGLHQPLTEIIKQRFDSNITGNFI